MPDKKIYRKLVKIIGILVCLVLILGICLVRCGNGKNPDDAGQGTEEDQQREEVSQTQGGDLLSDETGESQGGSDDKADAGESQGESDDKAAVGETYPSEDAASDARSEKTQEKTYQVLLGVDRESMDAIPVCDTLVIDGEYFTQEDVEDLKARGIRQIYSYLNVGSIEEFRDYYEEFTGIILGDYQDWPEEHWVNVADSAWQQSLLERAEDLKAKGFDGLFLDNLDVYYQYPSQEIYQGLIGLLTALHEKNMTLLINGGDCFVSRYLSESGNPKIFDGINQEDVYTSYDFDRETCEISQEEDREYYTAYCQQVAAQGYEVYTLEYADNPDTAAAAREYARGFGWTCYVSDNIDLTL